MAYVKTNWVDNTTPIDENNLNKIESGIKNNDINIGEENYDNTKTYEVGDIVRYNEKIYKCITAITTAENFDISKWKQTNIVEIVQSEKSKIYELIEAISTPIVGEGENITLNDTAEKRFENFDIEGNSEQETRKGKNYLNMFTRYKAGDTPTINGIKFTFNKDGSITCDGTASADATLDFSISDGGQKINGTDKKLVGLIGGEYSYTKAISCVAYDENWENTKNITLVSANKNLTQVMADNIEYSRFRIIVYKDTVINNRTLYLQVLDALQEDLSYEQYGASPSPDYPSEVECCGDNVNEFDKDNANIKNWYIDTSNKKIASGNSENRILIQEIKPNTTYTISKKLSSFIVATCTNMPTLNSSTTQAQRNDNATKIAIASGSSDKYLVVQFKTQADTLTEQEILNSIKIVEGTETGEYSPYGQGCINEVICNKNIFDGKLETGEYDELGNKISNSGEYRNVNKITIEENETYFFSIDGVGKNYVIFFYDKNGNFLTTENTDNYKVKTPSHAKYMNFRCFIADYVADYSNLKIQIEKNTIETPFEQHEEQSYIIPTQQPFRAIGNVRDKFILKENGKWYERHFIARKIFDGTETFTREIRGEVTNFYTSVEGFGSQKGYCNILPVKIDSSYTANILFIWANLKGISMMFEKSRFSTVSDYQAYLAEQYNAGTPVYVDYVLKEPLDIECTEEQSTILFDIEQNAKTYKGVTHIYSNDEVSPNCYVEAVKDLTTLIQ